MQETLTKYPKTPHLPWSPGVSSDDIALTDISNFSGKEVIVTEKMDGENSSLYWNGKTHARSLDSRNHVSRDWLKGFWSERYFKVPGGVKVCGENLWARHSIPYNNLPSYFLGFSIWEWDMCLSWENTIRGFETLNIEHVPILYRGTFDEKIIKGISLNPDTQEGYVVRIADFFTLADFNKSIAKFVRAGHVQTDEHWMHKTPVKNGLRK